MLKILEIEKKFDLVMIVEFFNESLVFLKHLLCASWKSISLLAINKSLAKQPLSEESKKKLKHLLKPEYMLFNHFYAKMKLKIEENKLLLEEGKNIILQNRQKIEQECNFEHKMTMISNRQYFVLHSLSNHSICLGHTHERRSRVFEYMKNMALTMDGSQ